MLRCHSKEQFPSILRYVLRITTSRCNRTSEELIEKPVVRYETFGGAMLNSQGTLIHESHLGRLERSVSMKFVIINVSLTKAKKSTKLIRWNPEPLATSGPVDGLSVLIEVKSGIELSHYLLIPIS